MNTENGEEYKADKSKCDDEDNEDSESDESEASMSDNDTSSSSDNDSVGDNVSLAERENIKCKEKIKKRKLEKSADKAVNEKENENTRQRKKGGKLFVPENSDDDNFVAAHSEEELVSEEEEEVEDPEDAGYSTPKRKLLNPNKNVALLKSALRKQKMLWELMEQGNPEATTEARRKLNLSLGEETERKRVIGEILASLKSVVI